MAHVVPPFATGPNFQVWISRANPVANDRNQRQTASFGSLWPWLTTSEKFRTVAKTSFCKGGTTCGLPQLLGGISKGGYLLQIEWQTIGVNAKQEDWAAPRL